MFRYIIVLLLCAGISCCQEKPPEEAFAEQSFGITNDGEDGIVAMRSLAHEAQAFSAAKERIGKQGWKAVGGQVAPIPSASTFVSKEKELDFYVSVIFRNLGYSLEDNPGAKLVMTTQQEVSIRHSDMALADFQRLLDRWKRPRDDSFDDLLNGTKNQANKSEMATPRKPSD